MEPRVVPLSGTVESPATGGVRRYSDTNAAQHVKMAKVLEVMTVEGNSVPAGGAQNTRVYPRDDLDPSAAQRAQLTELMETRTFEFVRRLAASLEQHLNEYAAERDERRRTTEAWQGLQEREVFDLRQELQTVELTASKADERTTFLEAERPQLRAALQELTHRLDRQQVQIDCLCQSRDSNGEVDFKTRLIQHVVPLQAEVLRHRAQQDSLQGSFDDLRRHLQGSPGLSGGWREGGELEGRLQALEQQLAAGPSLGLGVAGPTLQELCRRLQQLERHLSAYTVAMQQEWTAFRVKVEGLVATGGGTSTALAVPAPPSGSTALAVPALSSGSTALAVSALPSGSTALAVPALPVASVPEAVVFLDVDGVLHSVDGGDFFKETCCAQLERVLRASGASIVLAGSWCTKASKVAMVNGLLQQRQLPPVLDCTWSLADADRESEICEWLDRHPGIARWVVVTSTEVPSGEARHAERLRGRVVRTDGRSGLNAQDAERVLWVLLGPGHVKLAAAMPRRSQALPSERRGSPPRVLVASATSYALPAK